MRERCCRPVALAIVLGACLNAIASAAAPPVVPGYDRLRDEAKASPAELGQVLLGELNCAECHAAPGVKRVFTKGGPDLTDIGARATPQWLSAYLLGPHAVKPGTTMPDLFHASEEQSKRGAVEFLTQYLVSLGGPIKPATEEANALFVEQGRRLYETVGCVACHAVREDAPMKVPSVPLGNLAEKTTVDQLEAFLLDPLKTRPGSRMPYSNLSKDEAHAISIYLLRAQMDNPQAKNAEPARTKGVRYEYYDQRPANAAIENVGKLKATQRGRVDQFTINQNGRKQDSFAYKFEGAIAVPRDGKYTFYTTSDDGSMLYIDSKLVVNNGNEHAPTEAYGTVELKAGDHAIIVTFYQAGGPYELKVEWEGPEIKKQVIPADVLFNVGGHPMIPLNSASFTVEPEKAQMGGRLFSMLGCAACHTVRDVKNLRQAKPLAQLTLDNDNGCLGTHVLKGLPQYDLTAEQRDAIKAALKDQAGLNQPLEPKEQVTHAMAAMNCFACHKRGDVGGPTQDRSDYFKMTAEFDMGEEGRIPPHLGNVGSKLLPEAMEQIIFEGKLHVRPVLATRMPRFSKQVLAGLVDSFQKADPTVDVPTPKFSESNAKDGRTLVGAKGLGCINCHGLNGTKSLGMPAPDLGTAAARLKWPWYRKLLDNPPAVNPQTRMPQFWPMGQVFFANLAGGTEDSQIGATWSYLSLGESMALPTGLVRSDTGFELVPGDVPLIHRTFMADVGPRAILVGFPEMVHVAFDANGVRMAKAWRGRFFDAKGMWQDRGGSWMPPLGKDIINMPSGPAFAALSSPDASWPVIREPVVKEEDRNVGGHFKGYELDKEERPIFHYLYNGTDIREQPLPVLTERGSRLIRKFTLGGNPQPNLYFLAGDGSKIEQKSPGVWVVDDKLTLTLSPADKLEPKVRDSNGKKQLLVPVKFDNDKASFQVEMSW